MATLAADNTTTLSETRRAPTVVTNRGGLLMMLGALALLAAAVIAWYYGKDGDSAPLTRFWHAYLLGATYFASFSLGGLFFVIAHHLTGGRWATSLRRLAEIVAGTMWLAAFLFFPIVWNVLAGESTSGESYLYEWNHPVEHFEEQNDTVLLHKASYLNPKWFAIRTICYFATWLTLASYFVGRSIKQDETGDVQTLRKMSRRSGPAMVLFAVTLNFAAFDWLMSLAPHWFSTIFGVYFFAGSVVGFLSLLMLLSILLPHFGFLTQSITTDNRHDLAKLLFALIVFWGYIAFSQFMLIWYANVPEETEWYVPRQWSLQWLFLLHLFIPFLGFMSSAVRRNKIAMAFWAVYMMVVHWLDLVFIVMLGIHGLEGESMFSMIGFFEILCSLGVVAMLLGATISGASDRWLLPVRDPRLKQATTYHTH